MSAGNQKLKILYLLKIFYEYTDDEHTLTINEIIEKLKLYGISAERKSLYSDIEALRKFGLDIPDYEPETHGYYLGEREFQLTELKLLIDIVQSSKFITEKKSLELITKLTKLTSRELGKKLKTKIHISNRVKSMNENIYYNIDKLYEAIDNDIQVSFRYFKYTPAKTKEFTHNGEKRFVNPVALTFNNENYYLIAYNKQYKGFVHYRVDRMMDIELTDKLRILPPKPFDVNEYEKTVFSMYGGSETNVEIEFHDSMANVVFDHFGRDIIIMPSKPGRFITRLKVSVSPTFLSWIIGFGDKAKVISPQWVINELFQMIDDFYRIYDQY